MNDPLGRQMPISYVSHELAAQSAHASQVARRLPNILPSANSSTPTRANLQGIDSMSGKSQEDEML